MNTTNKFIAQQCDHAGECVRLCDETARPASVWIGLKDSHWVNLCNATAVLDAGNDTDRAVAEAVRLTESKLKELNSLVQPAPIGTDDLLKLRELMMKEMAPLAKQHDYWPGWPGTVYFSNAAINSLKAFTTAKAQAAKTATIFFQDCAGTLPAQPASALVRPAQARINWATLEMWWESGAEDWPELQGIVEKMFAQPVQPVIDSVTAGDYELGYADGFNDGCKPVQPAVPEGWQLVPVVPTYQMMAHALVACPVFGLSINAMSPMYAAMLSAAPPPAAQPVQPSETLSASAHQSWELHLEQAAAIRDLLDLHAPETKGNLQTRLSQVFAQPVQPLTDEQIESLWQSHVSEAFSKTLISPTYFARLIEAAHGIKGTK